MGTLQHKQACRFHTDPLVDCDSFATICVELAYIVSLPKMFFSSGQIIPPISFSPTGPKQHYCCGTKSETNGWMKNQQKCTNCHTQCSLMFTELIMYLLSRAFTVFGLGYLIEYLHGCHVFGGHLDVDALFKHLHQYMAMDWIDFYRN